MVDQPACPFCAIVAGGDPNVRLVYHTQEVTAFFPLEQATRGHTLIVPNRHVSDLTDLNATEGRDLGEALLRTARAVRSALAPDGLNVIQSTGAAATQTVPHVHFHLVPRWSGDRMVLEWPAGVAEDGQAQSQTLAAIHSALTNEVSAVGPEDRRQHLAFIQAIVTRMSQASSSSKTWLLPIVTATYGYAITKNSTVMALLGVLAVLVFGVLDANYLKQERAFRKLYDEVAAGRPIPAFSLNPSLASPAGSRVNYWPDWRDIKSWAVAPVYGPLLLAGVSIGAWLLYR
ncbi:HIT family protein [Actinocorallia lasiicapitis]